jgi:hypothetical protein
MKTRYFSLVFGLIFLVVGIMGFIPSLLTPMAGTSPPLTINGYSGYLFGLFPVNVLHNLIHVVLGLWGLAAWRDFGSARIYSRSLTVIYALLAVAGLFPGLNTVYGLVPLYSHDIWLHAATAIIAAYFGWAPVSQVASVHQPTHR